MPELSDNVRALIDTPNFATVATLQPDGSPQTSVVWVGLDGGDLVFSATEDRQKVRNLRRDKRVSVSLFDPENPYRHAELRGTASVEPDPGRALPQRLSHKYLGRDYAAEPAEVQRVVVRVHADHVTARGL